MCFTVSKSISTNSLLNCFFCPPIAFNLLVRRATASNVGAKNCSIAVSAATACYSSWCVQCNGYNCAQSATSPSCVRDSGARVSLTSALSSNLWPHRLLDSLKLGTIRLIVCIKECTIEQAWSIRHYLWMDWGRGSGLILRSGYQKLEINRGGGAAIPDSRILIV